MQTSVTFKKMDASDHLRNYVSEKLDRLDKYLYNPAEASVVLSVEKFRHICEVNIVGDRLNINGKEETNDMYSAIDMVLDKLEAQIKKSKQKGRGRRGGTKASQILAESQSRLDEEGPTTLKVTNIEYKPMDVEEAIMQIDLVDDTFLVFTNSRTDQVNVIYRRSNGGLGLIQPQ
jgi:putative sigma-54 modulation protein